VDDLESERLALEHEAYDEKNRLLNHSQFQELLELQTDEEPEFIEEIVAMYVDDAEAMLVELEDMFKEGATEPIDYAKARGVLHKLKGSSSTFGADGVQQKCEELREHCIGEDPTKCRTGEGSLAELRERVDELAAFLARYTAKTKEIQEAKAAS
jgi:histidine-containing phosphotransfer protein